MTDALTFAAWNGVLNVAGFNNGSPLAAPLTLPTSGVSSDTGGTSLHDYVRFTLFNNTTVTVDGNQLFALDGFSFSDDQTLDIGSASSGAGAGKVTFNPLHLSFTQPGLDPQLFQMLAAGTLFKEVDVLGYNVSGDGSHLVVDYSFGLVAGKTMSIDQSGITQLDLEFGQQEIQHFTQNPDGSFPSTPDTSGGWDRVRNIQVGPDQFADPPLTLPTSGVSSDTGGISLHDYVRFTLFNNTTVTVDGNQLFALDGFSFSDDQTLDIGSASSGAGAGKVTFNPLHLSFTQPGLDPQLFQMLAAGTLFKEVDVLGYNVSGDGSHLVVDYSFGLVAGKTMSIDQSGITQLDLEFGQQEIQHFTQNPDGSFPSTPDTSGGWDRVRNIQVGPDQFADPPLTLPTSGVSSDTGGISLHDYVRFTLFNNTTVTVDGNQLFALDGFSFSDDQTLDIGSASSGAGAGKVTFNPLHLSFTQPGLDPQLFQMLAAGTLFKEVDVLGYNVSGDGSHLVVDYSFGLVAGKTMSIDQSGITQLDLEFGQQEIQHFTQNPDGSFPSTPDTSGGWDRVRNIQVGPDQFADPPLTLPTSGVSSDTGGISLHDYVRFTLFNNTTVTVDGNQLFALDGFSFSDDQTLDIGSASSGAGAGKVTFNPLHLSFTQPGLDPQLFQMLAAGTLFKEVDVLGYNVSGDGSHLVVDYSFGLVAGKTMSIDQSGITQLDLEFGQQEIQHFTQNPDGSFPSTPDTSGGWDRVRNIQVGPDQFADPPLTLPTSGVSSDTGGISLHDYVRFTLFNNTTVTVDGNQLFALDGFSFSDDQTLDIGSASSGAGAGKVTFNPLHLSFTQPGLDPQLFQMLAAGTLFKEVDVLGYNVSGDGSHLVVDYSFGLVAGKTMSIDQSGITQLDLEFGQQEIQHFTQNPDGSFPSTPDTSGGWDRVRNIQVGPDQFADPPLTLPTSGVSSDTGGISLHDYVRFTLFNNTTVTVDGNQLFALDGFSFSDDQTLDIGSASSGAGAGKVTFNPLHLSFTQPGLDPQLFQMLAAGTLFKEVDVLGYNVSGDGSHLVVDYSFGLVAGKTMSIDQSGITQLDLEYGSQAIQFGNQAPVAADDPSIVLVGGTAAGNVLTNDSDPDGDSLTVSAVAGLSGNVGAPLAGTYGHLTLDADGSFSYAADKAAAIAAGATGSHLHDIFSYTASDGLGGTDNASLDITLDRLPVAADDTSGALAGGTAAGNVLVNDSDPDGDSLTVSAVFAAGLPGNVATPLAGKFGDLTLNADGSFNYAADKAAAIAAGATGNHLHDIFSYTASDGLGGTDNAILDITLDRLPVTADDTSGALAGGTAAGNVLANDNDPDGDSLTVSAVFAAGLPGNVATPLAGKFGDLTLNADGSFTYAADNAAAIAAGPTGSHLHDIFSYTASDGLGGTANASLDIALDRLPVAINDLAGVQAGKTISGNVLANDHDPDGDPIQLLGISGGSLGQYVAGKYGWLVLASDGTYNYASNKSASLPSEGAAQDSFTYTERDGQGGVAQATLSVTVVPNGMNYIAGAPGATISSGNGKSVIDASLGGETVLAGNGKDTIVGGPNDMLTGGNGPDTFQFGPSSGPNTIRDFDVHNDVIAFDHTLFADFTDIKAHIQQLGADAVITYHGTDTLTLQHVNAGSLHASDFVLV